MTARAPASAGASRSWPAPAKLNLMLHVTGRRADGYHELQTVFQLVDLCDELHFDVDSSGEILRLEGPADVPAEQDLVVRAAQRLRQRAAELRAGDPQAGVRIRVRKRIPLGGGLGGGSSDAATTLVALNKLWGLGLKIDDLEAIGLELGADVPVFVAGTNAWAEGVGERLTPLELPPRWYLILHPGVHITTRDVFQAPELTRNSPLTTIAGFLGSGGRNDCEPVVRQRYPAVAEALDWLSRFAPARLTGTGSCMYASFERAADAERVAARVPDHWRSFVARGLDRSPLLAALGD
jgi:4-diphosphocytidyl-2-C-methyl-D-erythritol kinase